LDDHDHARPAIDRSGPARMAISASPVARGTAPAIASVSWPRRSRCTGRTRACRGRCRSGGWSTFRPCRSRRSWGSARHRCMSYRSPYSSSTFRPYSGSC